MNIATTLMLIKAEAVIQPLDCNMSLQRTAPALTIVLAFLMCTVVCSLLGCGSLGRTWTKKLLLFVCVDISAVMIRTLVLQCSAVSMPRYALSGWGVQ